MEWLMIDSLISETSISIGESVNNYIHVQEISIQKILAIAHFVLPQWLLWYILPFQVNFEWY